MSKDAVFLFPRFTLDCWNCKKDDAGSHYELALSARGTLKTEDGSCGTAEPLISGSVLLRHDATFEVEPNPRFPSGISAEDARAILMAIFDDMGRGSRYDGDWCLWPIDLEPFLSNVILSPRWRQIARILRQQVEENNETQIAAGNF